MTKYINFPGTLRVCKGREHRYPLNHNLYAIE